MISNRLTHSELLTLSYETVQRGDFGTAKQSKEKRAVAAEFRRRSDLYPISLIRNSFGALVAPCSEDRR